MSSVFALSSLNGSNGFKLNGANEFDRSGWSVAAAGDINGDGFDDFIIGAPLATVAEAEEAGASYVIFGKADGFDATLELSALDGNNGFVINGVAAEDRSGRSVASAGDINGDGYDDLIIGAYHADPGAVDYAGQSYVVYGTADGFGASMNLADLDGTNGFALDGIRAFDFSGFSVSCAGDINGDGLSDVIIGAHHASRNGQSQVGETYVVFGGHDGADALRSLSNLDGTNGFTLKGINAGDMGGFSVASAGDFNGDGYADIVVGARFGDSSTETDVGQSYLVFGSASGFPGVLALDELDGSNGVVFEGVDPNDLTADVSSAGDFNGDGFDDIIVGARNANAGAGKSYVIFGTGAPISSPVDLALLNGTNGFALNGVEVGDKGGWAVSSAGDINSDGYDDLLIGAFFASPDGLDGAGATYVMLGSGAAMPASLGLNSIQFGYGGIIPGANYFDRAGSAVASAGDVNGDGYDDVIISSRDADPDGRSAAGTSYVIFGDNFTGAVTVQGTDGDDTLTGTSAGEALAGGLGDDTLDGGEGSDVLRGGAGDDILVYDDADNRTVDGGSGTDTLKIAGSGTQLNLAAKRGLFSGIEVIDLSGLGDNTLVFTPLDLLNLSDSSNTVTINGDAGDRIQVADTAGWSDDGEAEGYHVYSHGELVVKLQIGIIAEVTSVADM